MKNFNCELPNKHTTYLPTRRRLYQDDINVPMPLHPKHPLGQESQLTMTHKSCGPP